MTPRRKDLAEFQKQLGFQFTDVALLEQAFVHRSYLNEHPDFPLNHNERLEFLGDAVLELVVTEHLYAEFPDAPEGELTNWRASLVNSDSLARAADERNYGDYLKLSRGEAKDTNTRARQSILANTFEAVIGALYLDQGYDAARTFISNHLLPRLPHILKHKLYVDPKTRFQELAQERYSITPTYRVLDESGPDHAKQFRIGVYLEKDLKGEGQGASKQEAQEAAAEQALEREDA